MPKPSSVVSCGGVKDTSSSDTKSSRSSKFCFLSWNPDTYSTGEFAKTFTLPQVVRVTNCDEPGITSSLHLPPDVDVSQPILLYKKFKTVRVQVKCLKASKNGKLKQVGPSLIVPDSFSGWFTLLNPDGKECAMMLSNMNEVAMARIPAFLTKYDVPGYMLQDSNQPGGKSVYVRTTMKAGSILRILGVWADINSRNSNYASHSSHGNMPIGAQFVGGSLGGFGGRLIAQNLSHHHQQIPQPQVQYVQCLTQQNEPIFIPFWATGIFYAIFPRGGRNPRYIYQLSSIAKSHKLPLKVKMVCGTFSNNMPDFSGMLQIENVYTEEVLLACTLLKEKPHLFELDMENKLLLSQMTTDDLFIKSTPYQTALSYCESSEESWKRQIKPSQKTDKQFTDFTQSSIHLGVNSVRQNSKKSTSSKSSSITPSVSKLTALFRPGGNTSYPPLRRSKSFNVEVQSVSLSLTQDEEDEETKKMTLFNFKKKPSQTNSCPGSQPKEIDVKAPEKQQANANTRMNQHSETRMSGGCLLCKDESSRFPRDACLCAPAHDSEDFAREENKSTSYKNTDLPYGRVLDEVSEEDNIYSEISDALTMKLSMNPIHRFGINFHRMSPHSKLHSNTSSLMKGGGGSDGAFSGSLSGTFSSSNPSTRDDDIYDSVF